MWMTVVILKPQTALAPRVTFQPGELSLSLRTHLGAQLAADLSFLLSREQNLVVASTKNTCVADHLLGDFIINLVQGDASHRDRQTMPRGGQLWRQSP